MMNLLSSMSEESYDIAGNNILYGKLIDRLVEDFLTREDAKEMMKSSNLLVSTSLDVSAGIPTQVATGSGPATGATTAPGTGKGTGKVNASYKGAEKTPGTLLMVGKRKAEKMTGQAQTEGVTGAISTAAGGEI